MQLKPGGKERERERERDRDREIERYRDIDRENVKKNLKGEQEEMPEKVSAQRA